MRNPTPAALLAAAAMLSITASTARAQLVLRDKIVRLPAISICQDGATHRTVCTNHRLRPGGLDLDKFLGMPIEIRGRPGAVTCQFVDVASVTPLTVDQSAQTSVGAASMALFVFGSGAQGDSFLLFVGARLRAAPLSIPGIAGPIHLDLGVAVFAGSFPPAGTANPYYALRLPLVPALRGVDFYDQALVAHGNQSLEMTNVDCFQF